MKKLLLIITLVFTSSVVLNAECTEKERVKLIMNGISQASIDEACGKTKTVVKKQVKKVAKKRRTKPRRYAIKRERMYFSVGSSFYDVSMVQAGGDLEEDSENGAHHFSLGYILEDNARIELRYREDKFHSEYGNTNYYLNNITSVGLNYIYTFGNKQVETGSFKPFVMVGLLSSYYSSEVLNKDYSGYGIIAGLGVIYSLNNYIEFELSYDFTHIGIEPDIVTYDEYSAIDDVELSGATVAIRYKF